MFQNIGEVEFDFIHIPICPLLLKNIAIVALHHQCQSSFVLLEVCLSSSKTTHNHFAALLEFVRDYPGEQVPER